MQKHYKFQVVKDCTSKETVKRTDPDEERLRLIKEKSISSSNMPRDDNATGWNLKRRAEGLLLNRYSYLRESVEIKGSAKNIFDLD